MGNAYNRRMTSLLKNHNRGKQVKRTDSLAQFAITLEDIDTVVHYHLTKRLRPSVAANGKSIEVPIMIANPEKWKAIRNDGYLRDDAGRILNPLIIYQRTGHNKNSTMGFDSNVYRERRISTAVSSKDNMFSSVSKSPVTFPVYEIYKSKIPDYIDVSYDFIVFTQYQEHANALQEKFTYAEGQYWGDPDKAMFKVSIDGFSPQVESTSDDDRFVRTTFTLTVNAYLIPNDDGEETTSKKYFTIEQVSIEESIGDIEGEIATNVLKKPNVVSSGQPTVVLRPKIVNAIYPLEWDSQSQTISVIDGIGSPGGSDTQIQFNSAGTFSGSSDLTWDGAAVSINGAVRATSIVETSTRNLKTNIQSIPSQRDNILKLNPVSYNWKSTGVSDIGFIAEEVEPIYPQFIFRDITTGNVMGINYSKMISVLTKAIQELYSENESLKSRIFDLERMR